jgi:hypothetical protein
MQAPENAKMPDEFVKRLAHNVRNLRAPFPGDKFIQGFLKPCDQLPGRK